MRMRLIGDNSIANLLNQSQYLLQPRSDSALLDAQILLCFVLDKPRTYLLTWPEKHLSNDNVALFVNLLTRRYLGEPIAYITGEKEFWSLPFKVSTATLIPRPDTETLIELVLSNFDEQSNINCLDLGTGTGAIALALASENNTWKIDAVDFNEHAVQLAKENAHNLNLPQVTIFQSDWFSQVNKDKKYQLIVSNPPYIDSSDANLTQGDVRFEPSSALIAGDNGLADIRYIADKARDFLTNSGAVFFEHGFEQGSAVRKLLTSFGYINAQTNQDLNGKDRITWATLP